MFASHGTRRTVKTDNGAQYNSRDFANFAEEEGFNRHRITPEHPRANGEVEILNKTEQISHLQNKNREVALQAMLVGYRSTPYLATGVTPYQGMTNREVRIKLYCINNTRDKTNAVNETEITERDRKYNK